MIHGVRATRASLHGVPENVILELLGWFCRLTFLRVTGLNTPSSY